MKIVDTHFHVFGPYHRFPLPSGANYAPDEAPASAYLAMKHDLDISRMVVVQGSCYGTNNELLLAAIQELGPEITRGIAIIDDNFTKGQLASLAQQGVMGIRINVISDNTIDADTIKRRATAIADLGWHMVLHCRPEQLVDLAPTLSTLPVPLVIDHFGRIDPGLGVDQEAMRVLLALLAKGNAWVKLITYRSTHGKAQSISPLVRKVLDVSPDRCLWGTDWPHPLFPVRPNTKSLLQEMIELCSDPFEQMNIFWSNPAKLYRFS